MEEALPSALLLRWENRARLAISSAWLSIRLDVAPGVPVSGKGLEVVPAG